MPTNYTANDIQTLDFRTAIRSRIAMYMGSADNQGVLQCVREIITNSIDEATMGFGNKITLDLYEGNRIVIADEGRGCPFGLRDDGTEALEAIYTMAHSGAKFNDKVFQNVAGMNGIGAKGVALSSDYFHVTSVRDGKLAALTLEKGIKTSLTNFFKKKLKGEAAPDILRKGLFYAVTCKVPNPSFANQTKTKVNNPELRGLCQRATTQMLEDFERKHKDEFEKVLELLTKELKAEAAAERARKQVLEAVKDVEKNQKKKVFASDKLKDAEFLGENSTLLVVEGNSAMGGMSQARDYTKYGLLAIRGKIINCLSNPEEKIFQNEEIKLLLSAMNITPGKYDSKKLRYGKLAICTDADSDGAHIGLLIMAALSYLAPEFIKEGRLCWLRSPLYIVENKGKETYYFTDEEFNKARKSIKGTVTRAKGLGELPAETAHVSMFTPEFQRLERMEYSEEAMDLLMDLMGVEVEPRKDFIFENIDFSQVRE